MRKLILFTICILMTMTDTAAQENLSYQLPPESILKLADFERAPQVAIDSRRENMLFS